MELDHYEQTSHLHGCLAGSSKATQDARSLFSQLARIWQDVSHLWSLPTKYPSDDQNKQRSCTSLHEADPPLPISNLASILLGSQFSFCLQQT